MLWIGIEQAKNQSQLASRGHPQHQHSMPVFISDKLTESETWLLVAVLEKYRSVIGYSL